MRYYKKRYGFYEGNTIAPEFFGKKINNRIENHLRFAKISAGYLLYLYKDIKAIAIVDEHSWEVKAVKTREGVIYEKNSL